MKGLLFSSTAFAALALAAPASAQSDAPVHDWNGFYAGVQLGYGFGNEDWHQTSSSLSLALDHSAGESSLEGVLGGVQAGWNYHKNDLLLGIQADWALTDQKGGDSHVVFPAYAGYSDNDWTATVTGRVGYVTKSTVVYIKGGAAFGHYKSNILFSGVNDTNRASTTRTGWVAGAGVETALSPRWTAGLEADFMDFGSKHADFTYIAHPAGLNEGWALKSKNQVIKLVVNYHFGQ